MAYPPVHLHEPVRYLSAEETASHISSYLSHATKNPYLHPDAIFSAGGLQFGNYGGSAGGLVLHQLRRVEKGLRGERIAAATADIEQVEIDNDDDDDANDNVLDDESASKTAADLQGKQQGETVADMITLLPTHGDDDDEDFNKTVSHEMSQGKRGKKRKAPNQSTANIFACETLQDFNDTKLQAPNIQETEAMERNKNTDTTEYSTKTYSDQYKNQRKLEKKKRQKLRKRQKAEKLSGKNY